VNVCVCVCMCVCMCVCVCGSVCGSVVSVMHAPRTSSGWAPGRSTLVTTGMTLSPASWASPKLASVCAWMPCDMVKRAAQAGSVSEQRKPVAQATRGGGGDDEDEEHGAWDTEKAPP